MARYPLNLPQQLKQEAEAWAKMQGVSLNQFILWATAEKIGSLNQLLDDPQFSQITYRRGANGIPLPVLRGTGIRVQAIVVAHNQWGMTSSDIAAEYGVGQRSIDEALAFYSAHRAEIESHLALEAHLSHEADG